MYFYHDYMESGIVKSKRFCIQLIMKISLDQNARYCFKCTGSAKKNTTKTFSTRYLITLVLVFGFLMLQQNLKFKKKVHEFTNSNQYILVGSFLYSPSMQSTIYQTFLFYTRRVVTTEFIQNIAKISNFAASMGNREIAARVSITNKNRIRCYSVTNNA